MRVDLCLRFDFGLTLTSILLNRHLIRSISVITHPFGILLIEEVKEEDFVLIGCPLAPLLRPDGSRGRGRLRRLRSL